MNNKVSISQLTTYMSCPYKWSLGYIENLTPKVEKKFLSIGHLCHRGMEVAFTKIWENQQNNTPNDHKDIINECIIEIKKLYDEYINSRLFMEEEIPTIEQTLIEAISVFIQAFNEFDVDRYEVQTYDNRPALELHFEIPLYDSKINIFHGYIDAILRDKNTNNIWVVDYKFRKTLSDDTDEAFNIQNAAYTFACNQLGIDMTGTMTWQHLNTPCKDPQILKKGNVSRALIKTTWEHYKNFLIENQIDYEPYEAEMKDKLSQNEFYHATHEYRNKETTDNIWNNIIIPTIHKISLEYETKDHIQFMYPWNCKMCQYQSICQGKLRNYDIDSIKATDFMVKESKNEQN